MTEAEWLACTDPQTMLNFLRDKVSNRKLRLFAVACCRRIWHLLSDQRNRSAVEMAEGFADGITDERQLEAASKASYSVYADTSPPDSGFADSAKGMSRATWEAAQAATMVALTFSTPNYAIWIGQAVAQQTSLAASHSIRESHAAGSIADYAARAAEENERTAQAGLLRDIFSPFLCSSVVIDPAVLVWSDSIIPRLAHPIYDERAFDRLPILADALEEAGCTNADILNHCRQPGEHVRGCWVVDLLLGKP